jgi:hypothetical protein
VRTLDDVSKDKNIMSPAQIISAFILLLVGGVITQRVFSTSSTLAWDMKVALLVGVLGLGYFFVRWSWLVFTPAAAAQAPAQQQLPATALAPSPPVNPPPPSKAQAPVHPRATPDAGASVVFDLFKILSSPNKLSPEWRIRVLEYIDLRAQLNQSQMEMDKQSAKLDAMLPADDGVPPKTPTS